MKSILLDIGRDKLPSDQLEALIQRVLDTHPLRTSTLEQIREIYSRHIATSFGILSFSKVVDNILLWSHYADSHEGFCIEYDLETLEEYFGRRNDEDPYRNLVVGYDVNYVRDYPVLKPNPGNWSDLIDVILTTKSEKWGYEHERRYLWARYTDRAMSVDQSCISGIYVGCNCKEKSDLLAVARASFPRATIYQATPKIDSFGLDFTQID